MQPSWEEVSEYVTKTIKYINATRGKDLPIDQKEDITQEALIRCWKASKNIEEDRGWKSFMKTHCYGAFLDYLKSGSGFQEHKTNSKNLKSRLNYLESDGETIRSIDQILGSQGIFHTLDEGFETKIKWDLLSRIASRDDSVLILAKILLGFSVSEISDDSVFCRERVGQQVNELLEKFDDPKNHGDKWVNQIIYALGLSTYYGTPNEDNTWGWEYPPTDFFQSIEITNKKFTPQLSFFGESAS